MWKQAPELPMSQEQRKILEAWVCAGTTPQRMVLRAKICLLAAQGLSNNAIAKQIGTSRPTVLLWRNRFAEKGIIGISEDAPHGPSSRRLDAKKVKEIVEATNHPSAKFIAELTKTSNYLIDHLRPNDVLLVLSAGDANEISQKVLEGLGKG